MLSPALGIGAFAEKTLVAAGQCTKVDPAARPEVAGLLGCGVMAGLGAAHQHRRGRPRRLGRGHRLRRRRRRGDRSARGWPARGRSSRWTSTRGKLEWARQFGATHVVNSRETDPVEAIRELTGGNGADVVIEAVGRPETYQQAFYARDLAGTVVLVGVPTPDMRLELPLLDFFGRGGALKSSWYGDCLPEPRLPDADRPVPAGPAAAGPFVYRDHRARRVEEAFAKMHRGEVLRSVVML